MRALAEVKKENKLPLMFKYSIAEDGALIIFIYFRSSRHTKQIPANNTIKNPSLRKDRHFSKPWKGPTMSEPEEEESELIPEPKPRVNESDKAAELPSMETDLPRSNDAATEGIPEHSGEFWQSEALIYNMESYVAFNRIIEKAKDLFALDVSGKVHLQLALLSVAGVLTSQDNDLSQECRDAVLSHIEVLKRSLEDSIGPAEQQTDDAHNTTEAEPPVGPKLFLDPTDE
jgi:hypothetical protein